MDWQCIYTTRAEYKAELAKAILDENNIKSLIINKRDSAYLFGDIELLVAPDDVINAKQILTRENFE